jgi:hypothetical protein
MDGPLAFAVQDVPSEALAFSNKAEAEVKCGQKLDQSPWRPFRFSENVAGRLGVPRGNSRWFPLGLGGRSATTLVAAGHILNTLLSRNAFSSIAARNRNRISAKNSIVKHWLDDGGDRVDAVYNVVVILMIFYNGRMRSVVQFSLPQCCP